MSSRDARRLADQTMIPDDLDQLLREAMREQMGRATPPDHVWQRIEHQLRGGPSPVRRRASSRAHRTAPLVQALALASLVVVFALSLGQNLSWSLLLEPYGQQRAAQTPAVEQAQWPSPPDGVSATNVRQAPLLARERELEQQMSVSTVSHAGAHAGAHAGGQFGYDGMLSKRENLLLSREQTSEQQANDPDDLSRMASGPPRHREDMAMFADAP